MIPPHKVTPKSSISASVFKIPFNSLTASFRIRSGSVLCAKKITAASAKELDQYETGAAIKLRDGELVSPKGESTVYFISSSLKKPFDSYAAFKGMGFKPENIIYVDKKTLELHTTGEIITLNK